MSAAVRRRGWGRGERALPSELGQYVQQRKRQNFLPRNLIMLAEQCHFSSMEDRTQTKSLSTQKELSFSRSIYSTLWKKKSLDDYLIDPRGKHTPYKSHVRSVELRIQGNQVQTKLPNLSLIPKDSQCVQLKSQGEIPLQGLLPLPPPPPEVRSAVMRPLNAALFTDGSGMSPVEWKKTSLLPYSFKFCASSLGELYG